MQYKIQKQMFRIKNNISAIAHQIRNLAFFFFTKVEGCKAKNRLHIIGYEKGHLELKLLCRGPSAVFQIGC